MPDTYANPYAYNSPIGSAVANLSQTLLSGPTNAQRITQAEQALALKQKREASSSLADIFGTFGQPQFDRNMAMREAILGDYDPQKLADMERYGAANTYGAWDDRTTNAFIGAGGAAGSSPGGFQKSLAETARANDMASSDRRYGVDQSVGENRYEFDNTPTSALVNGQPVYVPRSGAFAPGVSPVLSDTERKGTLAGNNWANLNTLDPAQKAYLGADSSSVTPRNYVAGDGHTYITYDGVTDAQSGARLPTGGYVGTVQGDASGVLGTTAKSAQQGAAISQDQFSRMLDYTQGLVNQNPANVGATGVVKGIAQDAAQLAANLAQGLGFNGLSDAVDAVRNEATKDGINPSILSGVFDPTLPKLQTAYDLLVYSAASVLAGQSGRNVSDRDIQIMRGIVGSPTDIFGSQEKSLAKFQALRDILGIQQTVTQNALRTGVPGAAPAAGVNQPPAVPAPAVEQAPATPASAPSDYLSNVPAGGYPDAGPPPASWTGPPENWKYVSPELRSLFQ